VFFNFLHFLKSSKQTGCWWNIDSRDFAGKIPGINILGCLLVLELRESRGPGMSPRSCFPLFFNYTRRVKQKTGVCAVEQE
jgi:hypothetical protein